MIEIDATTAAAYLVEKGRIAGSEAIEFRELPGGVSNVVLLVTQPGRGERFVLKQARGRLRVKEEWLCPIERIWREVEVLRICSALVRTRNALEGIPHSAVPDLLWEDRENYLYAMTAAPEEHDTWKARLLAGKIEASGLIAAACGELLGRLHAASWNDPQIASQLDDRNYFEQLRLDPYYRHVARVHTDLAPQLERLIDSVWQHRRCLVHGDFSPKNLLVWPGHVMLIDFEVGHYGDPAFDLGFFLTHFVLKSIWSGQRRNDYLNLAIRFWTKYQSLLAQQVAASELADLERRMLWNLAGCMLARVDGKSPVDYLSEDQQGLVRQVARQWLVQPPMNWNAAVRQVLSTEY